MAVCCPKQEFCFFYGSRCYLRRWLSPVGPCQLRPCHYFILLCTSCLSIRRRRRRREGWHVCGRVRRWPPGGSRQAQVQLLSSWKPADHQTASGRQRCSEEQQQWQWQDAVYVIQREHPERDQPLPLGPGAESATGQAHWPGRAAETPGTEGRRSD